MDVKSALILGVCLIIAGAVLGLVLSLRTAPAGQEPAAGRFQIAGSPGHAYVLDTATGKVWESFEPEGVGSNSPGFNDPKLKDK
jgi:hypothetical protein